MGDRKKSETVVVEIEPSGLTWWKSSASGGNPESCLECAPLNDSFLVRDSRDRQGPRLSFPHPSWRALIGQVGTDTSPLPH